MSDQKYRDESYLGDTEEDPQGPQVQDLGFIVDDRDDRRMRLVDDTWERLDDLDTDEALETGDGEPLPKGIRGAPPRDAFATDYNLEHQIGEQQEEDFVETSMLATDPDGGVGADDFTSTADLDGDGRLETTDIAGRAPGITRGFGTSVPMDIGAGGFEVRDNPLAQPINPDEPISELDLSDPARGLREVDEVGDEEDLDRLADLAAREEERQQGRK